MNHALLNDWFPRTKAHLAELYEFFSTGASHLALDARELRSLHETLDITKVSRGFDQLEYVECKTEEGVTARVYADGLVTLSLPLAGSVAEARQALENYYDDRLSRAFAALFSIGAPLSLYTSGRVFTKPFSVVIESVRKKELSEAKDALAVDEAPMLETKSFQVFRHEENFVIAEHESDQTARRFVEAQAFRYIVEAQLHSFIDLHRDIWSSVDEVRKRRQVTGKDIPHIIQLLDRHKKLTSLLSMRLNQIGGYLATRRELLDTGGVPKDAAEILSLDYRTLSDALAYTKELWRSTREYVEQAEAFLASIRSQISDASISNLTVIAAVGTGSVIIGLLTNEAPEFSSVGFVYLAILVALGYGANWILKRFYERKKYSVEEFEQ